MEAEGRKGAAGLATTAAGDMGAVLTVGGSLERPSIVATNSSSTTNASFAMAGEWRRSTECRRRRGKGE